MTRRLQRIAILVTLALAACSTPRTPNVPTTPGAEQSQSAARGLTYTEQVCAACHAVRAGQQTSPNPNAPTFTVIANMPGMTPTALNAWLHSAHATMPNLIVSPADRADIAAYLETLKRGSGAA